jgi:hypothetical protein
VHDKKIKVALQPLIFFALDSFYVHRQLFAR